MKTAVIICFEEAQSEVGRFAATAARLLAAAGHPVQLFTRRALGVDAPGVVSHVLETPKGESVIDDVRAFTIGLYAAFTAALPGIRKEDASELVLIGCEWSAIPAIQIISALRHAPTVLCLQTLERQRSDMSSDLSKQIEKFEIEGIQQAQAVLVRGAQTVELARKIALGESGSAEGGQDARGPNEKVSVVAESFPMSNFQKFLDPGSVKARYLIGPIDPTFLFVGPLDEDHGPDLIIKAVPAILKKHKQARFVFVGEGPLFWMLRIYARYLNLDHAVRVAGHVEGDALHELVQAADIVVVPQRRTCENWPILAGWSAGKAVLATHEAGKGLMEHEENGVLIYPLHDSVVWGACHILETPALWGKIVENGKAKVATEFGEKALATQLNAAMGS